MSFVTMMHGCNPACESIAPVLHACIMTTTGLMVIRFFWYEMVKDNTNPVYYTGHKKELVQLDEYSMPSSVTYFTAT